MVNLRVFLWKSNALLKSLVAIGEKMSADMKDYSKM